MRPVSLICLCSLFILFSLVFVPKTFSAGAVFSTWDAFEVDKCASIWLIKRFIDPQAEIRFFPHGTTIRKGIPFDTPQAKFRRYATRSTFETLLTYYHIKDSRVQFLGRIIHDIEVNVWEQKKINQSKKIQQDIRSIILKNEGNPDAIVKKSLLYFDAFYQEKSRIP